MFKIQYFDFFINNYPYNFLNGEQNKFYPFQKANGNHVSKTSWTPQTAVEMLPYTLLIINSGIYEVPSVLKYGSLNTNPLQLSIPTYDRF